MVKHSYHFFNFSCTSDIVESGAITSFVSIAQSNRSRLRSIAIEALRVISEDFSVQRQTRRQLCEAGAAKALGATLKDDIRELEVALKDEVHSFSPVEGVVLRELYEALCALANILDQILQEFHNFSNTNTSMSTKGRKELQRSITEGCLESGGLESLLAISSLPFLANNNNLRKPHVELIEKACRCLASLSPILLTEKAAKQGYSKWAINVLAALHHVLQQLAPFDRKMSSLVINLYISVLQGVGALAKSAALKVRIIDRSLPLLLQASCVRDQPDVSTAASQAFQSLDLTDDEVAVKVAGNAPSLFADWFCLKRSLLIQAMARAEIRKLLEDLWVVPLMRTNHGSTKLIRSISHASHSSDSHESTNCAPELFRNFADDDFTKEMRSSLMSQYKDIFAGRGEKYGGEFINISEASRGLLSHQAYPLDSCNNETCWILDHRHVLLESDVSGQTDAVGELAKHVQELLKVSIPSNLLREQVVPIHVLRPDASFDFRAILMAQKRYLSFQREGQLVLRLHDKEVANMQSTDDAHWTLSFTNSSFAGEFAESFVQMLYKCPAIEGLSFVRTSSWKNREDGERDVLGDCGSSLLASIPGSLPPWISYLTFEGFFDGSDIKTLTSILESMGELASGNDEINGSDLSQGKLKFLAIRSSKCTSKDAWEGLFGVLGSPSAIASGNPLFQLKYLDLSSNDLGDDLCGLLMQFILDRDSTCKIEELDISGNRIGAATCVLKVLRRYCSESKTVTNGRKSRLHSLRIGSNNLNTGKAWIEICSLVRKDGLELETLDLSFNEIMLSEKEQDLTSILVSTVTESESLAYLDLSSNKFSPGVVDIIISHLADRDRGYSTISLNLNTPPLSAHQSMQLKGISLRTRTRVLERYFMENKTINSVELGDSHEPKELATSSRFPSFPQSSANFPPQASTPLNGTDDNMITVLFSAPLVYSDSHQKLRPFAKLDFVMERELMWQCLKEASRDIKLTFDTATHDRLLAALTKRCSCLHYSGHGHQQYLPFEDGSGQTNWIYVDKFKGLIECEGGAPFRFVFVSACYSYLAGKTFASAGVPHVVCCQQESELKDTAALAFTRQFYLALAIGHTVKESFEQGCKAVRVTPNLKNPDEEMKKFLLLPEDGDHNVPIFNAKPVPVWPLHAGNVHARGGSTIRRQSLLIGGARSSELSVRNMMQEDPSPSPPDVFLGREVDMFRVLENVLKKRLVSVVGDVGVGKSSLVRALCHYINERASTMICIEHIYFVKAPRISKQIAFRELAQALLKKLDEEEKVKMPEPEADMETMFDVICKRLKQEKALVVFERADNVIKSDEANEFPLLLSKLCRETKNVKVLLTNLNDLGIPSLGETSHRLQPLDFANTVRLFASHCLYLHTHADRRNFFETLVPDSETAELLPTDPLDEGTKNLFTLMGDGIPAKIEKAAYNLTKEKFLELSRSKTD
jgi:hypothetical protein